MDDVRDEMKDLKRQVREQAGEGVEAKTYTVQSGDTLSRIAKEFLGDANRWPEIFEANKDTLDDPNAVKPGQELTLPS